MAERCAWAGVACLFAMPILVVANASYGYRIDLHQLLRIPYDLEMPLALMFLASWVLAGTGLLFRSCELQLEAGARTPGQKKALHKVNLFRRVRVLCILGAIVIVLLLAGRVTALSVVLLLPLIVLGCLLLHHRIGQMVLHIMHKPDPEPQRP